jgi:hypothetical protein
MKKHSCGAILYTIYNYKVYIVLGMEKGGWFPFKGIRERGETNMDAAIREIKEETCNAVIVDHIDLNCNYSTKRKHYHIGLTKMTYSEYNKFYKNRFEILYNNDISDECKYMYLEKDDIKMFPIDSILNYDFHEITSIPIKYYYNYLTRLQKDIRGINIYKKYRTLPYEARNAENKNYISYKN